MPFSLPLPGGLVTILIAPDETNAFERCSQDPFYDTRIEVAHFRFFVSGWRVSLTQTRRDAILVSKIDVFVYLGHGIVHRDAIWFLLRSVFR